MADQQAELDALVEEALGTIVSEVGELKTLIEGLQPGKPLDLSKLKAIKARIQSISDEVGTASTTTPEEGKHNVKVGFTTTGGEEAVFKTTIENNGVTEERAAQLRSLFDAAKTGSDAQDPDGDKFDSAFSFKDNTESDSFTLDNEAQKAAADVAVAEALLQIALAQLSKFQKPA